MDKLNTEKVSIIIPAYNEENNITLVLEKVEKAFREFGINGEVVVVNDGSTDKTAVQLEGSLKKYSFLRVVKHRVNKGLTQSLNDGFLESRGEILVFLPADLQYLPEDIPKLLKGFELGYDIVAGWRQAQGGYKKRLISNVYNYLSRKLFKINIHDLNSIKAFRREVMDSLILSYDWHRYMLVLAANQGFKIGEVKVNVYPRKFGRSKFGFPSVLGGIMDLAVVKIYTVFSQKPSVLFSLISFVFLSLGTIILGLSFVCFFTRHDYLFSVSIKTWLLVVANLVVLGLLFFLIGYLAELITHIKIVLDKIQEQVKKK